MAICYSRDLDFSLLLEGRIFRIEHKQLKLLQRERSLGVHSCRPMRATKRPWERNCLIDGSKGSFIYGASGA